MCSCQAYGKTGVPNARGFCLVCGEPVEGDGAPRRTFGQQLAAALSEDRCQVCGVLIGIGIPLLHLGLCDACRAQPES